MNIEKIKKIMYGTICRFWIWVRQCWIPRPWNATLGSHWRSPAAATHCVHAQCRRAVGQPIFVRTALRGWHLGPLLSHLTIILLLLEIPPGLCFLKGQVVICWESLGSFFRGECRVQRYVEHFESWPLKIQKLHMNLHGQLTVGRVTKLPQTDSADLSQGIGQIDIFASTRQYYLSTASLYWLDPSAWHGVYPDSETMAQRPRHSFASATTSLKQNNCHLSQLLSKIPPFIGLAQGLFWVGWFIVYLGLV